MGVAEVDRLVEVRVQEAVNSLNEVVNITKTARLRTVAINRQGFAAEGLAHEVGQNAAIIQPHARTVSVEDPADMGMDSMRAVVRHRHRFGKALGLVVDAAQADA